jgi:hypothetical protein
MIGQRGRRLASSGPDSPRGRARRRRMKKKAPVSKLRLGRRGLGGGAVLSAVRYNIKRPNSTSVPNHSLPQKSFNRFGANAV